MPDGVAAVIQARIGSSRLPGKVLAAIAGRSQLERVVRRCRASSSVSRVIVATTTRTEDDAVAHEAGRLGADVVRGDENDVLSRYVAAMRAFALPVLLRITADNPLVDPSVIDAVVARWRTSGAEYVTTEGYPLGVGDVELVVGAALTGADAAAPADAPEREHVTRWIVLRPAEFRADTLRAPDRLRRPELRLTVDYPHDLEVVRFVYESFGSRDDFDAAEIIELLDRNPEWARYNRDMQQRGPR